VSQTKQSGEALVIQRLLRVPRKVDHATVEVDARVGGKFRIVMHHSGKDVAHWGEYRVIDPPSLLSFTWISVNTDNRPTLVTVELRERGGNTELTLTHRDLPGDQVDNHRRGWTAIVAELDRTLSEDS
jgi:uncharacterized protein YndB with AHSA1/START domain